MKEPGQIVKRLPALESGSPSIRECDGPPLRPPTTVGLPKQPAMKSEPHLSGSRTPLGRTKESPAPLYRQ